MKEISFYKMQGAGNDFVIIDGRDNEVNLTAQQIQKLAHRNFGIGCDQLIIISHSPGGQVKMTIHNQDGSAAGACGNAARCVAKLLNRDNIEIDVGGRKIFAVKEGDGTFTINMGEPNFAWQSIPLSQALDPMNLNFDYAQPFNQGYAVSIGNPHLIFFLPAPAQEKQVIGVGPDFEKHDFFPKRVNVNFAYIRDSHHIDLKVWERGAGLTLACGSGACATVAVAHKLGLVHENVTVTLLGGNLNIKVTEQGITMNGDAQEVFQGKILI
jgi:diaminopimelate epimerase